MLDLQPMKFSVLHTEWSSGWGGQEQRIILESMMLRERGHDVVIACQPGSGILAEACEHGIPTEEVTIRGSFDLRAIYTIARLIRKHRITVVNTHSGKDSWVGAFAAKLARAKLLVRTRHLSIPISNNPLNFIYRFFDGFITTGEAIRETMIRDNRVPPDRIVSISTGVSLERFNPDSVHGDQTKRELGIPSACRVITMVAVLRSMKRHDLLIEAAKRLSAEYPDVRFLVVGDGQCRDEVIERIRAARLQDFFILTGYRTDIPELLSMSDIVVLTSDRFEGVPQSLSQAMSMGRAVVAAPVGSTAELVLHNQTGLMAICGNASSFAEAIGRLLDDPALRQRIGEAARQHILENYTDEIMIDRTIKFYNLLLDLKREE